MSLADGRKADALPHELCSRAAQLISSFESTHMYTDGSKSSDGVGCAFVSGRDTRSFSLPANASVFTAELVAILKALCFIEVSGDAPFIIFTDSLSSLLALMSFYPRHPTVQDILARLTFLHRAGKDVQFCWIPSHVGISGNELADAAARRATSVPPTRRLPLPARDFFPCVHRFISSRWQRSWDAQGASKLRSIKPCLALWSSSFRANKHQEVSLCRLRIGHTYATHGHLLRGDERPVCSRCREPVTVKHVLLECPRYARQRARHLGHLSQSVTLKLLLADDSRWVEDGSLFSFVRDLPFQVIYSPW